MRKSTFRKWQAEKRELIAQAHLKEMTPSAMHEAGHALALELLLTGVQYAELRDNLLIEKQMTAPSGEQFSGGTSTGFTESKSFPLVSIEDLECLCIAFLAGPAAEELYTGSRLGDTADISDMAWHVEDFNRCHGEKVEVARIWEKADRVVIALLAHGAAWQAVKEIANVLISERLISGDEVRAIVDRNGRDQILDALVLPDGVRPRGERAVDLICLSYERVNS